MSNEEFTPPRNDAAWQAAKQDVARRNEAAYTRGRQLRAARDATDRARRVAMERREYATLPRQPAARRPANG